MWFFIFIEKEYIYKMNLVFFEMTVGLDRFATNVWHYGEEYSPQEVLDYLKTSLGEWEESYGVDASEIIRQREDSTGKVHEIVNEHGLDLEEKISKDASGVGLTLAKLVLEYGQAVVLHIQKCSREQGRFV